MTLVSWAVARATRLRRSAVGEVAVQRDLPAAMPDGAVLLADRWYPTDTPDGAPTVVLRSPYGRRPLDLVGRLFAERGYQVVIQSCRGTFGSGGEWDPFRNEQRDGRTTLAWIQEQPWFGSTMATFGASYLGLTQWAVLADPPAALRAAALNVTASNFRDISVFPGGSFSLETGAAWLYQLEYQERGARAVLRSQLRAGRALAPAYSTLPLADADSAVFGHPVAAYQDWLAHATPGDPWWSPVDFGRDLARVPPVTMVAGWFDIFLPAQLADYEALRRAGREVRLTVGPWTHASPRGLGAALRDGLEFFDSHLWDGGPGGSGGPGDSWGHSDLDSGRARLYVMGSRRWISVASWPPSAEAQRWHLHAGGQGGAGGAGGGRLDRPGPDAGPPARYRYDPADPTPGIGGASLNVLRAGRKDQRPREGRSDVLTYTTAPFTSPFTVVGPVTADLWFRSDVDHTDVFVRLCDVTPQGRSYNVSDGIIRLTPERTDVERGGDGVWHVRVPLWPTAMTWRAGHRLRLQVSSGAHPLFARNTNSGEPLGTAATLQAAAQEVFHDPEHPSALELPVFEL